ncbi:hypothetical protein, partial [Allorhizobium taibaishanense]
PNQKNQIKLTPSVSLAGSLRSKNINDHDRLDEPAHHQHQSMLGKLGGVGVIYKLIDKFILR